MRNPTSHLWVVHNKKSVSQAEVTKIKKPSNCFLVHKSEFLRQHKIPGFDEVENKFLITDWKEAPKYIFVSHRYLSISHADDQFGTCLKVVQAVLQQMEYINFVWIDFSCVPFENRMDSLMNIQNLISYAEKIVLIPLKSISTHQAPVFDLLEYSTRAWCALEYSISLAQFPSKVVISQIMEEKVRNNFKIYTVKFISLPCSDEALGFRYLEHGMEILQEAVEKNKKQEFLCVFTASVKSDLDIVWGLLRTWQPQILQVGGATGRVTKDTAPQATNDSHLETKDEAFENTFLYDQSHLGQSEQMNSCSLSSFFNWSWLKKALPACGPPNSSHRKHDEIYCMAGPNSFEPRYVQIFDQLDW